MTTLLPPGTDPEALAARLRADGRTARIVPRAADRPGAYAAFAAALEFPAWFGRNLDALLDCLRDLPDGQVVIWDDAGALRAGDPAGYRGILAVLGQLSGERPDIAVYVIR